MSMVVRHHMHAYAHTPVFPNLIVAKWVVVLLSKLEASVMVYIV